MRDHADKAWLEERRGMEMLTGAMAFAVLAFLGVLFGVAGADWWTGTDSLIDLVADLRSARTSLGQLLAALRVAP